MEDSKTIQMEDVDKEEDSSKLTSTKWDYAIMFGDLDQPTDGNGNTLPEESKKMIRFRENEKKRKQIVKRLKNPNVGLTVQRVRSSDGKAVFLLITTNQQRLEDEAELSEWPMKLKDEFGGGYAPYEKEDKAMFVGSDSEHGFFRPNLRHALIMNIIQGEAAYGGAEINVARLTKAGVITKMFPLHDEVRDRLVDIWAMPKNIMKYQPLDEIRNYYGEEVGFYFAWLGFYTQWLWAAAILGTIAFICLMVDLGTSGTPFGIWVVTAYSIFLAFWATLFLEYWKRNGASLAFLWGMLDYKDVEMQRPDYRGVEADGVYYKGQWIPIDTSKSYGFPLPTKKGKYYPSNVRNLKVGSFFPLIAGMVVLVVIATLSVLSFRLFCQKQKDGTFWGSLVGGIANSMTIIALNVFWKGVAVKLTEWENHRLQSEFDNALIFKIFIFYFVNSYTSLYYIAFFKKGATIWNVSFLEDSCKYGQGDDSDVVSGCPIELLFQLATILGTNMIFGQAKEVAIPWVMSKIRLRKLQKETGADTSSIPSWERDSKLQPYQGTFDEYSEMVIQYGYITLFASAFPLAPLLAVANNIIEIRTDAFKLLTSTTRPDYRGAANIGNWYAVLEVLGVIAVLTNCLLIGFSFAALPILLNNNSFHVLGVVIIMEHGILFIKYIISILIPDVPGDIMKKIVFHEWAREQLIKKMTGVNEKKFDDDGVDDLNDVDKLIEEEKVEVGVGLGRLRGLTGSKPANA